MNKGKNSLILILALGLLLRLVVMPFSLHWDFLFLHMYPNLWLTHGVINIYAYIAEYFSESVTQHGWNYYPPLTYLFFSFYQWLVQPIAPTLSTFLTQALIFNINDEGLLDKFFLSVRPPNVFWNLFVLKIPFLFFEGLILWSFFQLEKDIHRRFELFKYWLFNPIIIYAVYLFGQFDILPTALLTFAAMLLLTIKKRTFLISSLCMVLVGTAIGFKTFPLFLLIPTVLLLERDWSKRLFLLLISFIPVFVLTLPFLHPSLPLWRIWLPPFVFTTVEIGFVAIMKQLFFVIFYVLLHVIALKNSGRITKPLLFGLFLTVFLLIYNFSQFSSLHYLVWAIPFFPFWFSRIRTAVFLSWLLFFLLLGFKITHWQHQFGLLVPLHPEVFSSIPTIETLVTQIIQYNIVSNTTYILYHIILFFITTSILFRMVTFRRKE